MGKASVLIRKQVYSLQSIFVKKFVAEVVKPAPDRIYVCKRQLTVIPSIFNVDIPVDLSRALTSAKSDAACEQIGTEWLLAQCKDLLANGAPVLHFYTMGKPDVVINVLKELF